MESSACLAPRGRAPVLRETREECLDERGAQSTNERIRDAAWTRGRNVCGAARAAASEPFGRESWRQPNRVGQWCRDSGRVSEKFANGLETTGAIRWHFHFPSGFSPQWATGRRLLPEQY